jgi:hypothetical protein
MSERAAAEILRGGGALFEDMTEEAQTYLFARNFHHQLKAQLLDKEVVVQVIRETTIDPSLELDRFGHPVRSVQEPAKIAWNFSTTLYFKGARQQPWQLADVRPRVCYVGLVFKEDPSPAGRGDACCAAQMFLNSGNGVVFRSALGPWYSQETREWHLARDAAKALIDEVVTAYKKDHHDNPPPSFSFTPVRDSRTRNGRASHQPCRQTRSWLVFVSVRRKTSVSSGLTLTFPCFVARRSQCPRRKVTCGRPATFHAFGPIPDLRRPSPSSSTSTKARGKC